MLRRILIAVAVVAVAGGAFLYAQPPGAEQGGRREPTEEERQRQREIQELRMKVERAPKAMASHEDSIYIVKEAQLLKLDSNLELQKRVDLEIPERSIAPGQVLQPQLTASASGVFLSGYQNIKAFDHDLNQTASIETDSIRKETDEGGGLPIPGAE